MRSYGSGGIVRLEKLPRSKCRKWRLKVRGNDRIRTRTFRGTYSQATKALDEFMAEITQDVSTYTFAEYAEVWLSMREKTDLDKSTLNGNRQQVKAACLEFGSDLISKMDRRRITEGLDNIRNGNNASGRKLSGTYMHKIHSTLRLMFKDAYLDDLIPSNPMDRVPPPRRDTMEKKAATPEDVARMLHAMDTIGVNAHTVAVKLSVLAGLRRSEVVGLNWGHYDGSSLRISQSIRDIDGEIKPTKTRKVRRVPVMPALAYALDEWRIQQRDVLSFLGMPQTEETPIVTSEVGTRMRAQNLERWWRRNRDALGIDCTLHGLRHTFLTMLANSGAPIQSVKSIAGWSDISMANTYIHTDEARNDAAVAFLGVTLGDTRSVTRPEVRMIPRSTDE